MRRSARPFLPSHSRMEAPAHGSPVSQAAHPLAPRLRGSPFLRPRRDLPPIPQPSSVALGDRGREPILVGDLVDALLADAEEVGDLDDADDLGTVRCHVPPRTSADGHGASRPRRRSVRLAAEINPSSPMPIQIRNGERDNTRWLTCPSQLSSPARPTRTSGWVGVVRAASACCGRA
jgi:hypothetical protein